MTEELSTIRPASLTPAVLGGRGGDAGAGASLGGSQRLPVVDYLVVAAAQGLGAAVFHYDRDYDWLAEVMEFESIWLAPPGTLP